MNTQVQNQALNEQPPNQNRSADIHKHDNEQMEAINKKASNSTDTQKTDSADSPDQGSDKQR